jgi:uracil phosphoribosyltransferase
MQTIHLAKSNSLLKRFLNQLRDVNTQNNALLFRHNIEKIGQILAYEISKTLSYKSLDVSTPLGTKSSADINEDIVVISILRAGLALHQGFMSYFDQEAHGFVSAYRHHEKGSVQFDIRLGYEALPELKNKTLLLIDPMLATGQSIIEVYKHLIEKHQPAKIILATIVAAPEGIAYVEKNIPSATLFTADIDDCLNEKYYIMPGLGDAGDLAYGVKV